MPIAPGALSLFARSLQSHRQAMFQTWPETFPSVYVDATNKLARASYTFRTRDLEDGSEIPRIWRPWRHLE
uniref:GNAT family N-acetyltransferase n=1 Tax=Steinernema glaseri TaxID=37863 RepID=A0A1I7YLC8_9BILA